MNESMSIRGERFNIDIGESIGEDVQAPSELVVKDVLERSPIHRAQPPSFRPASAQNGGFPAHKSRRSESRFRSQRGKEGKAPYGNPAASLSAVQHQLRQASLDEPCGNGEHVAIDLENRQRLQSMSDDEIVKERSELEKALDPLVLAFLKRRISKTGATPHCLSERASVADHNQVIRGTGTMADAIEADQKVLVTERGPLSGIHFPKPPQSRDIDADSVSFLDDLHEKYFPTLAAEPEKLAWMKPTAEDSSYSPDLETVRLVNIRFDFRGCIVPPKTAANIPVTKGLHHHGDAPESAGYTIPELAHLGRSTVPMQRCMAYQTLGRILFRLGSGYFGELTGAIPQSIRQMTDECCVLETLRAEANKANAHLSAKNYATEALWLWQRAGGRAFKAA